MYLRGREKERREEDAMVGKVSVRSEHDHSSSILTLTNATGMAE